MEDGDALPRLALQEHLERLERREVVAEDERLPFLAPSRGEALRLGDEPGDARVGGVGLLVAREGLGRRGAIQLHRQRARAGEAADVDAPRRARAGRERLVLGERGEELLLGAVGVGPDELEEAEEARGVGLERRRGEEEEVLRRAGEGRDGALRLGVEDEPVRLVDDEEVEARLHRLLREAGLRDEVLERDRRCGGGRRTG